jgi:hypothetical protein
MRLRGLLLPWNRTSLIILLAALALAAPAASAQQPEAEGERLPAPGVQKAGPVVEVRGWVRNAATGEPVAHALVTVEAGSELGRLTDAQGRFEFPSLPSALLEFMVRKPGYHDAARQSEAELRRTVRVSATMPELVFALSPGSLLEGQIQLSSGDAAERFTVNLLRREAHYGRMEWRPVRSTGTDEQGHFVFADLQPGSYKLCSRPRLENVSNAAGVDPANLRAIHRTGYPAACYPDARTAAGGGEIHLRPGEQARADVNVKSEAFYPVGIPVPGPDGGLFQPKMDTEYARKYGPLALSFLDADNRLSAYEGHYDADTHTIQADLPDGEYTLRGFVPSETAGKAAMGDSRAGYLVALAPIRVSGHAVYARPAVLFAPVRRPIAVKEPAADAGKKTYGGVQRIWMSPAGDPLVGEDAELNALNDADDGSYNMMFNPLSPQWLHVRTFGAACLESVRTEGADPRSEPVVNNPAGPNPALELVLRRDCARLTVTLPAAASNAAVMPGYSVWIAPEFATLEEPERLAMDAAGDPEGMTQTLAPGRYRVYTLLSSAEVPYRDAEAMRALAGEGQPMTLSAGESAHLVLELPAEP